MTTYLDPDGIAVLTPCADDPVVFDALVDKSSGRASNYVIEAALRLCGGCAIRQACWDEAAANGEPWFRALRGQPMDGRHRHAKPANAAHRSKHQSARAKGRWDRRNAERLETLRELIDQHAPLDEVLTRLGITRSALWKWCDNHGHKAEWFAVCPPPPRAVVARVRRKRVAA